MSVPLTLPSIKGIAKILSCYVLIFPEDMWTLIVQTLKWLEQFADGKSKGITFPAEMRYFILHIMKILSSFFSRFFPQERPTQVQLMTSNKLLNTG